MFQLRRSRRNAAHDLHGNRISSRNMAHLPDPIGAVNRLLGAPADQAVLNSIKEFLNTQRTLR